MTIGRAIRLADESYVLITILARLACDDDRAEEILERARERMARRRSLVSVLAQRQQRAMGLYR